MEKSTFYLLRFADAKKSTGKRVVKNWMIIGFGLQTMDEDNIYDNFDYDALKYHGTAAEKRRARANEKYQLTKTKKRLEYIFLTDKKRQA